MASMLCLQVMGEDLVPEKMREENQDGESLDNISLKNFEDRWWNRLLQTGLLGPDEIGRASCRERV